MISISDDQSLPLDVDGTLNPAASSMAFDSTFTGDATFNSQGVAPNVNSSGRVSPHHRRTMKDQETQLQELKKENFGLKLRIYHMEEALQNRWGAENPGWKLNVELQVQLDEHREELKDKEELLVRAKNAIDTMARQHEEHVSAIQGSLDKANKAIEEKDATIASMHQQLEEAEDRCNELEAANEDDTGQHSAVKKELSIKAHELEALQSKFDDLDQNHATKEKEIIELKAEMSTVLRQLTSSNADIGRLKLENEQMACLVKEGRDENAALQARLISSDGREDQLSQMQKDISDKDRKIQVLDKALEAKEAELASVQKALEAREQSLAGAAKEASTKQQQCDEDIAKLNNALRQLQDGLQQAKQAIDERDCIIKKLQEELAGATAKLDEADSRLLQLSTSQAAEMGILRGKTDELEKLLDQKEKQLRELRDELDAMRNAKDVTLKDLEKARLKGLEAEYQMKQLANELKNKADQLARTEHDLQQARAALNQQHEAQYSAQEAEAELLRLKSQNEDLQRSLQAKEAELGSLKESIQLKDQITKELLARQQGLLNQKAELEAMKNDANKENQKLMHELQQLQAMLANDREAIQQLNDHVRSLEQTIQQLNDQLKIKDDELSEALRKLQAATQMQETPLSPNSVKHFLQSIVQGLHSVQNEIAAGRHDSTQASSSIKSQLKQLAELQQQLAELPQGRDNTTPGLSIYAVEPDDPVITPTESVASLTGSDDIDDDDEEEDDDDDDVDYEEEEMGSNIPPLAPGESLLSLDGSRHSSTDFDSKANAKITDLQVELEEVKRLNDSLQNQLREHDRLHSENEQLKRQYELERDNLSQQVLQLQAQLQLSEEQSQRHLTSDTAGQKQIEELRNQVNQLSQRCKSLQAQLQKAEAEVQRLKELQTSPKPPSSPKHILHVSPDKGLEVSPTKSPSKSPIAGSVKALQEKYQESIRLNQELQERLHAQLNTTPPLYTPDNSFASSAGTSPKKQDTELAQLKQTMYTVQEQLDRAKQDGTNVKQQLLEAKQQLLEAKQLDGRRQKELEKLQVNLANAENKVSALEGQLDKILKDKNRAIEELTQKNSAISEQLNAALAEIERLKSQQPSGEVKEQLAKALRELEELKKQNSSLNSQLRLLVQQLAQKDQQLASLQKELSLYQQLLGEKGSSSPLTRGKGQTGNILKLLEEVRALRDQLGAGIQSNMDLSNELRKKLEESGGNLDLSGFEIRANQSFNGSHNPLVNVPHDSMRSHDTTGTQTTVLSVGSHVGQSIPHGSTTWPGQSSLHGSTTRPKPQSFVSSPIGEDEPDFVEPVFDCNMQSRSFDTRSQPTEMRPRRRTVDSSVSCGSPGVDKMIQTISEAEGRLKQALESTGIQGIDRSFLEELLRYLEQQRNELEEGRKLLGMLGVGGAYEQSEEIPFKLDLSKIYEQLVQAKALAGESKSILQKKHYRTQKPKN